MKIVLSYRRQGAAADASNSQANSKYYRMLNALSRNGWTAQLVVSRTAQASAGIAGGLRHATFKPPLGQRRFSVKGRA